LVRRLVFITLISGLVSAQTNGVPNDPSTLADEVKQLREMMVQQQKQLADQQRELQKLRQQVGVQPEAVASKSRESSSTDSTSDPRLVNASLTAPLSAARAAAQPVSSAPAQQTERKESPLSFRIGGAEFTPGGFMDFTTIFRSANLGSLGTNFFNVPFSTAQTAHLTETRFTAQNSRLSLKAASKFGKNDVSGYVEMDFLGNDSTTNVFVTSNSHTLRQRLYFLDLKRDKFELVAGQMWGMLTPNRVGLSPYSQDVFYSQDMDFNYQVGLTWTRQPGIRFIYHPNDNWAMGLSLENPEQFGGQGEIAFPVAFAGVSGEINSANTVTTPNLHPDIVSKIAYDTTLRGKHFHVEAAGLLSGFKIADTPSVTGAAFLGHSKEGGGISGAINLELVKNFHFVSNAFWSDGGGRYIFGMAPDLVVFPVSAGGNACAITGGKSAGCDLALSLVHSGSGIVGLEWQATPKTLFYTYYGAMYAQRNFAKDITNAAGNTFVGFGGPGTQSGGTATASQNRAIQEPSIGWIQTFWKNPQYGALQLLTQGSYITRSPWFVPPATATTASPKNAHLFNGWVDLRYVLP
jgi:hypothetical protein